MSMHQSKPSRTAWTNLIAWLIMASIIGSLVAVALMCAAWAFNVWDRSRLGPLQRAACDGNVAECNRLVRSGIPVDAPDFEGVTALSWAVFCCKIDVVQKLIELGADVNHVDKRGGFTPLMYTATPLRGHDLRGTQEERNAIARLLVEHGANVNAAMDGGQTTLHFAAADKNAGLVRILLVAGANRNVKSDQGYTPLDVAKFPDYAPNKAVIEALTAP